MHVLSVLLSPAYFTDFRLWCLLACRIVKISDAARSRAALPRMATPFFGIDPRQGLSPLRRGVPFRQARLRPGREARLHRLARRRSTTRWERLPSGRSRSRPRSIFMRATFRAAIETGDLTIACYCMDRFRHFPDPAERSARRGVARVGEGAGLRPASQIRRSRRHHREQATLHRDHAGPDRDLLHLQRRAVRRGDVRAHVTGERMSFDDLLGTGSSN